MVISLPPTESAVIFPDDILEKPACLGWFFCDYSQEGQRNAGRGFCIAENSAAAQLTTVIARPFRRMVVAIRVPLGICKVLVRRKGERIPTTSVSTGSRRRLCRLVPLGRMTEVDGSGSRRFVVRTMPKSARERQSTPLAPPLGELSSASETERAWECQWGKEWTGCVLSFQLCSGFESGDPFPQCAHWGLPLKGAAPCGIV